ncbi:hypothetical protein [Sediminibacter sp. Hel_I_10]|uniref:hypothetical protein n=1 Tax=Sediminibacter sp. Hel_I_10 TaxID=1392490 RepID=UPI0018CC607D|nr:hypothetical protein [Sediminibacter sp. Hel_I_10]
MKFVKDEDENRNDYILQKDETTKKTSVFVIVMVVLLIVGVIASGIYFATR